MPAWIHNRAEHLLAKNPSMGKSQAFAIATQQSHRLGKSPKGYGTAGGKREAEAKYDKPKKEYVKTDNPGKLESPKMAMKVAHILFTRGRRQMEVSGFVKSGGMGTLSSSMPKAPKLPSGVLTPEKKLKKTQDIGSVGAFDQKTQGVQLQKFKPMSMMPKAAFATSQYSGPLGPGRRSYRDYMGMPGPTSMPSQQFTTNVGGKLAGPPPGDEEGTPAQFPSKEEKHASLSRACRNALEAVGRWQTKQAAPVTPAQKLNNSRGVGAPKLTPPPGPSIQQIAKPSGFGLPAPGATKTL